MKKLFDILTETQLNESWDEEYQYDLLDFRENAQIRFHMQEIRSSKLDQSDLYYEIRDELKNLKNSLPENVFLEIEDVLTKTRWREDADEVTQKYKNEIGKIAEIFHTLLKVKLQEFVAEHEAVTTQKYKQIQQQIEKLKAQ